MITRSLLVISLLIVSLFLGAYSFFLRPQIAYVETQKLFDSYVMKKEYDEKLHSIEAIYNNKLDSLKILISNEYNLYKDKTLADPSTLNKLRGLESEYQYALKRRLEVVEATADKNHEAIWNRINSATAIYAKENGIDFILGANGLGGVMFANESENITSSVVSFINKEYEGKSK